MTQPIRTEPPRAPARTLTAARSMLEVLAQRGVRAVFGIPGGLVSPLYDALSDVPALRAVTTRHEGAAAFAAMGHAVATGEPALVLTTSGPGITNAITGIAAAFAEGLPLIAMAGEVPAASASRAAIQDATTNGIDGVAMLRTVTRFSARIDSPAAATGAVEQALLLAQGTRPGPVFLSVPLDVSSARVEPPVFVLPSSTPPPAPDPAACREAARHLERARRPLIIAGNGARGAATQLRDLAERRSVPVVTTPHAKGVFPESHPLHLGGIGFGGHPSASDYLDSRPDVVLIVGSRLGDFATNGWTLPLTGGEATIQIDREPWLIGRNYPVQLGIVADARAALELILAELPHDVTRPGHEGTGIRRVDAESMRSDAVPLKPGRVFAALNRAFPDALFTCDQGEHCAYAIHYLEAGGPDDFHTMVALASMGSGIGIAIGAQHALPRRRVVGICGDGGFAMHAGEVLTCVEHKIPVMLAVINDGRYNMVNHGFRTVFGRMPTCLPAHVADIAGVARAFGAMGAYIRAPEDLDAERLRSLADAGRPVVLDIRIDPDLALSRHSRSAALRRTTGDAT